MKNHRYNMLLERKIYNIIRDDDENSFTANVVDTTLMIFVIVSVFVAFLNTFDLTPTLTTTLSVLETLFVVLFMIEYFIRLWTSDLMYPHLSPLKARLRYMLTPMALIDFLSFIPYFLPIFGFSANTLKVLKLMRLFRIFKINRYTQSLGLIGRVLRTRATQLLSSVLVIFILIFIASMLMYDIENVAQPEVFDNALSAMWWAISTITTVGYGDIYPITTFGKILSALITFLGIGLTAIPTAIISAGFIEESRTEKNSIATAMHTCPHCGKSHQ